MDNFQKTAALIKRKPTEIWGLSFEPDLSPEISNDQDHPLYHSHVMVECSDCNLAVARDVVAGLGDRLGAILEIGIARPANGQQSLSHVLMAHKPEGCVYLGVDIDDRSYLDQPGRRIHTLRSDSHDQAAVRGRLAELGVDRIDLLLIDGWHSVNACINDWRYADLLSPGGVVMLHDTNAHPGPVALYEAVDPALFDRVRHCTTGDNGLAVMRRTA